MGNNGKKYQIFISSTYEDLKEERAKVQETILKMYHFPVGMEMFSAADIEQWEVIKETIDISDYYILIIGHRYGSVIEDGYDKGMSYTEKEFRYAKNKGIPVLVFIVADGVPVQQKFIEHDENSVKRLANFIHQAKSNKTVQWWENKDDLAVKVVNSLNQQFNRKNRPGWIRADAFTLEECSNELIKLNKEIVELKNLIKTSNQEDFKICKDVFESYNIAFSQFSRVRKLRIYTICSDVIESIIKFNNVYIDECIIMMRCVDDKHVLYNSDFVNTVDSKIDGWRNLVSERRINRLLIVGYENISDYYSMIFDEDLMITDLYDFDEKNKYGQITNKAPALLWPKKENNKIIMKRYIKQFDNFVKYYSGKGKILCDLKRNN